MKPENIKESNNPLRGSNKVLHQKGISFPKPTEMGTFT